MCMALGGRAAEAKIFRRVTTGMMSASPSVRLYLWLYFMGERNLHRSTRRFPIIPSNQKTARPLHISLQQFSGGRLVGRSSVMWSVGRFVSLLHSVILVTICVSYAIFRPLSFLTFISCYFLFLKGAEDDLRKVTDLAYKQVSYHFPQLRIIDVRKGSLI